MSPQDPALWVAALALAGTAFNAAAQVLGARSTAKTGSESAVYNGFKHLVDGLEGRVNGLASEVADCHRQHQDCEREREADRITHRREIDDLKAQIVALLRDTAVPDYKPSDLRRVGKT